MFFLHQQSQRVQGTFSDDSPLSGFKILVNFSKLPEFDFQGHATQNHMIKRGKIPSSKSRLFVRSANILMKGPLLKEFDYFHL